IHDIRDWHAREPDGRVARQLNAATYGYDAYPGNCHMVPNHALTLHNLLSGAGDYGTSLAIVNPSGDDSDCTSRNAVCLPGLRSRLASLRGDRDWRGPVADRLYLATADGGRAITDAVAETYEIVNIGRALAGMEPVAPKGGARFHFELPGSVQGFTTT